MIEEQQPQWSPRLIQLRTMCESIGEDLPKDGDWIPVIFVDGTCPEGVPGVDEKVWGKKGMFVVGFPDAMEDIESKKRFADLMFMMAIAWEASGITMVSVIYMTELKNFKPLPGEDEDATAQRAYDQAHNQPPPSKDPNRREALALTSIYVEGEDDGLKLATADIDRSGEHPRLHNWQLREPGSFLGRFPEAMEKGLKCAQEFKEFKAKKKEEGK